MNPRSGKTLDFLTRALPVAAALVLETKSGWEFFHPQAGGLWLVSVLCLHLLAAVLFALQPPPAATGTGWKPAWSAFLFAFTVLLPGLGMAGLLAAVLPSLRRKRAEAPAAYRALRREPLREFSPTYPTRYGPGGFRSRLLSQSIPSPHRLQSLLALKARATPDGNRLIREVLRDPADELRLMAYGTLERREMDFQKAIAAAKSSLAAAQAAQASTPAPSKESPRPEPGASDLARRTVQAARERHAWRRLAFLHWEMAYQELAEGELARYYLEQALSAAQAALAMEPDDSELAVLKGRIQARLGDWDSAWQTLEDADRDGGAADGMVPHRAELAFLRGDFAETRSLLARARENHVPKPLAPVLRFWLGKAR